MYDTSILIEISPSITGLKRVVSYEGIQDKSMTSRYAKILWKVIQLDENGMVASHPDINSIRSVSTEISDYNRVNQDGLLIEDRNSELWKNGTPEFSYWWILLHNHPLPVVLKQAAEILDTFKRFDKN